MLFIWHQLVLGAYVRREEIQVDIVIPSSDDDDRRLAVVTSEAKVERDRDNGELKYTLRAIRKNAPFVRRIFILKNGEHEMPDWVPEPEKTTFIDRCTLLSKSNPKECPTRNSFAVQTVVHKVPDLREHFIFVEDDDLLMRPTTAEDFFTEGKPRFYCWDCSPLRMYGDNLGKTGLSEDEVPMTFDKESVAHTWLPLTKSFCAGIENNYSKWFSFVRSHWQGRYSSEVNETGTKASEDRGPLDEEMQGVWWYKMRQSGAGVESRPDQFQNYRVGVYDDSSWDRALKYSGQFVVNINDDMSSDQSVYRDQHSVEVRHLDEAFPAPEKARKQLFLRLEAMFPA